MYIQNEDLHPNISKQVGDVFMDGYFDRYVITELDHLLKANICHNRAGQIVNFSVDLPVEANWLTKIAHYDNVQDALDSPHFKIDLDVVSLHKTLDLNTGRITFLYCNYCGLDFQSKKGIQTPSFITHRLTYAQGKNLWDYLEFSDDLLYYTRYGTDRNLRFDKWDKLQEEMVFRALPKEERLIKMLQGLNVA